MLSEVCETAARKKRGGISNKSFSPKLLSTYNPAKPKYFDIYTFRSFEPATPTPPPFIDIGNLPKLITPTSPPQHGKSLLTCAEHTSALIIKSFHSFSNSPHEILEQKNNVKFFFFAIEVLLNGMDGPFC